MNSQNTQPLQATFMSLENAPQVDVLELPPDFKVNGLWHVNGEIKGGTLRRKGLASPTAYFLVTHPPLPVHKSPFSERTKVKIETRGGLNVTGLVQEYTDRKDASKQGICTEFQSDGKRCERRRFWKTLCRDHTKAAGYEITDDGQICKGKKGNGDPCTKRAKVSGFCAQHGGGSAPLEKKTFLYEFPIEIIELVEGPVEKSWPERRNDHA